MTVVALRPSSTPLNEGALTGGGALHTVLSDDSDGSYAEFEVGEEFLIGFGDLSLPAGAQIKRVMSRIRDNGAAVTRLDLAIGDNEILTSGVVVFAVTPTTHWRAYADYPYSDSDVDAVTMYGKCESTLSGSTVALWRLFEAYIDVVYVTKPSVGVGTPSGTITDTTRPQVAWLDDFDSDGGAESQYEIKIFDSATYGGGGFDPDTSTPVATSGTKSSDAGALGGTWTPTENIADGTYRAYVRTAQTVNGSAFWTDWAYSGFVMDIDRPGVPTLTVTADNTYGRVRIDLDDTAGDVSTDLFYVERSYDAGANWSSVRTDNRGIATPAGGSATIYDYEAPNGGAAQYRAMALHTGALFTGSEWSSGTATWSSGDVWFKHPHRPSDNAKFTVRSQPSISRAARQGVFQPLGATKAIVVSDTRGGATGELVVHCDTDAERVALDELLEAATPLLVQMPATWAWEERWLAFGDHIRERPTDRAYSTITLDSLSWVEVERPDGDLAE